MPTDAKDKKPKLDGLKRLSHEQLTELNRAVSSELERRAKESAKKKPVSAMSDREFEKLKQKYFNGDDSNDD